MHRSALASDIVCAAAWDQAVGEVVMQSTLFQTLARQRGLEEYKLFLANFRQAAQHLAETEANPAIAGLEIGQRQFMRWLGGEFNGLPRAASRRVLEHMFDCSAEALFSSAPQTGLAVGPTLMTTTSVPGSDPTTENTWTALMASAADESARFAQLAETTNVGPHTLEQMAADVARIVSTYPNRPVVPLFLEAKTLRDRTFSLLEGRQPPLMTKDLYVLAGTLCGVLANAAFDLGAYHAAHTHARTALLCAKQAGHHSLQVWLHGMQALISYWDNRPADAVHFAQSATDLTPEGGTAGIRLASIESRAHARLGHRTDALAALHRADDLREQWDGSELLGGMMAFPVAKQHFYASTSYLWLGEPGDIALAGRSAEESVGMYTSLPAAEQRLGELSLARMDLALADLCADQLDGAADQVDMVLEVSARRPTESVARRLDLFARRLSQLPAGRSSAGTVLLDALQSSTRPPALPAGDME
ncbi:hypothetical protein E6W39_02660 [Kitasatospora acidiphila]|uniref:XRE family transcriptional regulator n=1 Tax=Kitasatospora acidiphila TaxID=2567942 RepID=A0A540VX52_9ACTN|nr:hypothetical protein [Kitasatospora acidiphila]TQF01338.1 hypothetical protein E6W39_02660 [Kitasatospora acidiphila]